MSSKSPYFSIITVTRSDPAGVLRTARSLAEQSMTDFEWILCDGAREQEVKANPADLPLSPHKHIVETDTGPYDGMNKGLKQARGRWVLFLNGGDELASPLALQILQSVVARNAVMVWGGAQERAHDRDGTVCSKRPRRPKQFPGLWWGMPTHHQAMAFCRAALPETGFDIGYPIAADYDLVLALRQGRVACVDEPICLFASGGLSQQQAAQGRREQEQIRAHRLGLPFVLNRLISLLQIATLWARRNLPKVYGAVRYHGGAWR